MRSRLFCGIGRLAVVAAIFGLLAPAPSRADDTVLPGFSLLEALPGTSFLGVPFVGSPLGTFDFGGGPENVGNTAAIVRRLNGASAPSEAIPIELVALHLMSAVPADFGCGNGTYFITLQSERGGPSSVGRMTINFGAEPLPGDPHGTFDSFFDVFFDVRLGALDGPICLSDALTLTEAGLPWTHEPPPDALLIDGINEELNGNDRLNDFHPIGNFQGSFPNGSAFVGRETLGGNVPEPGSLALFAAGGVGLIGLMRRRKK